MIPGEKIYLIEGLYQNDKFWRSPLVVIHPTLYAGTHMEKALRDSCPEKEKKTNKKTECEKINPPLPQARRIEPTPCFQWCCVRVISPLSEQFMFSLTTLAG